MMQRDRWPAVTVSAPDGPCDQQLCVTAVTGITTSHHTFTLVFRHGVIAVLHVHGASDQGEARAFACGVLPGSCYEVKDGDETFGCVKPFHAWTCTAAQEALSLQEAQEQNEIRCFIRRIREQMRV